MARSQSRRTTPSAKTAQRSERDAMLRLLMHAVEQAGGTLTITTAEQQAMPAAAQLLSKTDPETGAMVLTLVKPSAKTIEVNYAEGGGPHDPDLPPGLRDLLSSMDPRPEAERTPYHQSATTDALQAAADLAARKDAELPTVLAPAPEAADLAALQDYTGDWC